jgi:hypothetical protein
MVSKIIVPSKSTPSFWKNVPFETSVVAIFSFLFQNKHNALGK